MIQYVDDNLAGITTLSLSTGDVTLSASQRRMCMLRLTGTLLNSLTITNANNGLYLVENVTSGSFTVFLSDGTNLIQFPQGRRAVVYRDAANGPRIVAIAGSSGPDPIPTGTVMLFAQSSAPTGWTVVNSISDYGMRIVTGTSGLGGSTFGSVVYSTVFGRSGTDAHTLTLSEIPSHTHPSIPDAGTVTGTGNISTTGSPFTGSPTTTSGASGGGNGHSHNMDNRVLTLSMILATKN